MSPARRRTEKSRSHHRGHIGRGAVGVGRQRQFGEHVLAGLTPPVLHIFGEPFVEPGQGFSPGAASSPAPISPTVPLSPKPSRKRR